jgi:amylosucrase
MTAFERRLHARQDELEWLYMELYNDRSRLRELEGRMECAYEQRSGELRRLDSRREKEPDWYRAGNMLGVTMYTELFAGDLPKL